MNKITLQQDSHDKLKVDTFSRVGIEYHAKKFFGWRTPTKNYDTIYDRVQGLGTTDYDKFIEYLTTIS